MREDREPEPLARTLARTHRRPPHAKTPRTP
jgi:hypothetical protein